MVKKDAHSFTTRDGSKPILPYWRGMNTHLQRFYHLFWCSPGYHGFNTQEAGCSQWVARASTKLGRSGSNTWICGLSMMFIFFNEKIYESWGIGNILLFLSSSSRSGSANLSCVHALLISRQQVFC